MAWASRKLGDRVGMGPVTEQVVEEYPYLLTYSMEQSPSWEANQ